MGTARSLSSGRALRGPVGAFPTLSLLLGERRTGDRQLNISLLLRSWNFIQAAISFTPICGPRKACSIKTEFTFLKGNLLAPASELLISVVRQFSDGESPGVGNSIQGSAAQPSFLRLMMASRSSKIL